MRLLGTPSFHCPAFDCQTTLHGLWGTDELLRWALCVSRKEYLASSTPADASPIQSSPNYLQEMHSL